MTFSTAPVQPHLIISIHSQVRRVGFGAVWLCLCWLSGSRVRVSQHRILLRSLCLRLVGRHGRCVLMLRARSD